MHGWRWQASACSLLVACSMPFLVLKQACQRMASKMNMQDVSNTVQAVVTLQVVPAAAASQAPTQQRWHLSAAFTNRGCAIALWSPAALRSTMADSRTQRCCTASGLLCRGSLMSWFTCKQHRYAIFSPCGCWSRWQANTPGQCFPLGLSSILAQRLQKSPQPLHCRPLCCSGRSTNMISQCRCPQRCKCCQSLRARRHDEAKALCLAAASISAVR